MSSPAQTLVIVGSNPNSDMDACLLVTGSCEHSHESLVSTDNDKFIEELSSCQLVRHTLLNELFSSD
jgi:hypothetical protein